MAYYLLIPTTGSPKIDGLSWVPTNADDWSFEVEFETGSDIQSDQAIVAKERRGRVWKLYINGGNIGVLHKSNWSVGGFVEATVSINTKYLIRGEFDGTDIRLYFDDVLVDSVSGRNLIGSDGDDHLYEFFTVGGGVQLKGGYLYRCKFWDDASQINLVRDYDPSAASGVGQILYETQNNNDGTLDGFPTDPWVYYDVGGGGSPAQEIVLNPVEQINEVTALDVTHDQLVTLSPVEQINATILLNVGQGKLIVLNPVKQINETDTVSILDNQLVTGYPTHQVNNSTLITFTQSQDTYLDLVQQVNETATLVIDQSNGAQLVTLINTEQYNESGMLDIVVSAETALEGTEQLNQMYDFDIIADSVIELSAVEQKNQTDSLNVTQMGSQGISLELLEQINGSSSLSVTQASLIENLIVEQLNQTETVDINSTDAIVLGVSEQVNTSDLLELSQLLVISTLTSEQINQIRTLNISQGEGFISLRGIKLVPVVNTIQLNPIQKIYKLEEQ